MTILSIQSHVAYGYVGNRAAAFPLQRLGYDVSVVNTVQFSNHTGYGQWRGEVFSAAHIAQVIQGLEELGVLAGCRAILSGYLGSQALGREVLNALALCRQYNPDLIYLCDPVMGDVGRGIFVQNDIPEFIASQAIPQAMIVTPNHFEMELLAQRKITSIAEARQACAQLRAHPEQLIIITSFKHTATPKNTVQMLLSSPKGDYLLTTPYLSFATPPNGTGDLFSALFLGYYLRQPHAIEALERAAAAIYGVLAYTFKQGAREMQLIQAQAQLLQPTQVFKCETL